MKNLSKIITIAVAVLCIGILVYLIFFFNGTPEYSSEITTTEQKEYTISFEGEELLYSSGVDFMQGVKATDSDGNDLTDSVTVSCKPTNDIKKKVLTYSVNKSGYKIMNFERTLVIEGKYKGPSISYDGSEFEIPIDKIGNLSSEIAKSGIIETDDGFGGKCSVSAAISSQSITVGDYAAKVTAQNIFGDIATVKIAVTVTDASTSIIKLKASSVSINRGDSFDPMEYVSSAVYGNYGDVLSHIVADNTVDTKTAGVYTVEYRIKNIAELKDEKAYLYVTVN